ncbi:MAG: GntR family transcriptional regulator [Oscillospiraceae bacterium]|nr:GntR family transcriptional regulator [Oscillospiraceae bacterium]MCD8100829.1 GntR family transcriptional regulator [Oscillospiraceae bacterium]
MISLNHRDARPIYEQIKGSIRRQIVSGALKPDERLPSVRELAGQLAINPNTIQRAYRELEQEGWIYSMAGRGSFVEENYEIDTARRDELLERFDTIVAELDFLNVSREQLIKRIKESEKHD